MIWVAYNHNGVEICRNADIGIVVEEAMFYEEVTGNRCSVKKIEYDEKWADNIGIAGISVRSLLEEFDEVYLVTEI